MVYTEEVRQLASEENLINDSAAYTRDNAAWGTLKNYGNITLSEDYLVVFKFTINTTSAYRLKIGSYYVYGCFTTGYKTGIAFVAAGTYAILMEQKNGGGGGSGSVSAFQLGKAKFSDVAKSNLAAYAAEIDLTVAQRSPASFFGTLKNAVFAVLVWAKTPGAVTSFENVGDAYTNGVQLSVDGVQVDWTTRIHDATSDETACANFYGSLSVGSAHTFTIGKDNVNTVVHISIIGCPWLLAGVDNQPVTLDFPQVSTLYVTLEPLDKDPTKNSKIGKVRAVSYGDATDFYSTASGTGILSHTYTFEIVAVSDVSVFVNGFGGCISLVGVDER
jgi:hypothetical protein